MGEAAAEIEATALIDATPDAVFEFLSDLGNHWRLVDRYVEVISLTGPDNGPPDSGVVRLRGPLGVRRTVHTRVTATHGPRLIIGTAELEPGTRARVSWTLAKRVDQTEVRLSALVERAGPLDRLLLTLGGRVWLSKRFAFGLEQLASAMLAPRRQPVASTSPPTPSPPDPAYQSEGGSS